MDGLKDVIMIRSSSQTAQFGYDGTGNRLRAVRNGVETRYIYDAGGNLLAEADGSNVITRYYIHGMGLVAMVTPAGQLYTYHYNAVGSTIAVTDQNQNIVNKYAYDEFGNIMNQVEAVPQPFKFVGQYGVMTEPNGFYYMRARYYDPKVGRFISEDPIGFEGGDVNLYLYASNNPLLLIDPLGLCSQNSYKVDYFDLGMSTGGAVKDWFGLAKISTPTTAALASASLIVNKLGIISAVTPDSSTTKWIDVGLNGVGLGLAVLTGGTGAVVMGIAGLAKAAHDAPVPGLNQTVGSFWKDQGRSLINWSKRNLQR